MPNVTGKTPCATCPKIPPDAPLRTSAFAVELNERNWRAWKHYQQCAAVGQFPDDPLVRRNAAVIAAVLKTIDDSRLTWLSKVISLGVSKHGNSNSR